MRTFIVFASLLALSAAAPQFGGYGYEPQPAGSIPNQQIQNLPQQHRGGKAYLPPATTTEAPIVHKQFYTIGAPEDTDNTDKTKHFVIGRPQKNYRVVFIKAPGSDNDNVKISAEFAPKEEKTVIYVLSKKGHELNANDIATPAPTQPSKPEVYFIKYKTPEEAEAARKEIQDKYDQLGGTNEYTPEESAPVTNIAGALDGATPDGGYDYKPIRSGSNPAPFSDYLPPKAYVY